MQDSCGAKRSTQKRNAWPPKPCESASRRPSGNSVRALNARATANIQRESFDETVARGQNSPGNRFVLALSGEGRVLKMRISTLHLVVGTLLDLGNIQC